jgi:hypothetical protein
MKDYIQFLKFIYDPIVRFLINYYLSNSKMKQQDINEYLFGIFEYKLSIYF